MELTSESTIKVIQANLLKSLIEHERSKSNQLFSRSEDKQSLSTARFGSILYFTNEIYTNVCEKTLEIVLFKYFIGELNMKKIVFELFKSGQANS